MRFYNDYNSYLKKRYGCKIYRIGLDAGLTCPNRDGKKGSLGCIYCNHTGSRSPYTGPSLPLKTQLENRIRYLKNNKGIQKFIAYFQAFTNTYADTAKLKEIYDSTLPFNEIVGLSIGTRPDTIDREKLDLIASYKTKYEVWLEYGLQSSHDETLRAINRGHTFEDFASAVKLSREYGLFVSAHIIIGLPGETGRHIIETAERLAEAKIDGIKIHPLHILRGSALEKLHRDNKVNIPGEDEYVEWACDLLERIPQDVIVQRLTGQGAGPDHIAQLWALNKTSTLRKIEETFSKRGTYQGYLLK